MIQLVLVLIINTLVLMAWGRFLKYLKVFKEHKTTEHRLLRFIMTGNIFSMILVFIIYPFWQTVVPELLVSTFTTGLIEEISQFVLFILLAGTFQSYKEPEEGIILIASLALGFSLGNNFLYAINSKITVFLYKSVLGLLGNITFSLLWGTILSVIPGSSKRTVKRINLLYAVPMLSVSLLLHGTYNSILAAGQILYALTLVLLSGILFIAIYRYVKEYYYNQKIPENGYRSAALGLQIGGR